MPTDTTPPLPQLPSRKSSFPGYSDDQMLAALARAAELERERDALRRERMAWLVENGPGGWIDNLRRERDALRATLERVTDNFRRSIAGKPVRDMAETFAEADAAVAAVPMLPNSDLGHQAERLTPGVRSEPDA